LPALEDLKRAADSMSCSNYVTDFLTNLLKGKYHTNNKSLGRMPVHDCCLLRRSHPLSLLLLHIPRQQTTLFQKKLGIRHINASSSQYSKKR